MVLYVRLDMFFLTVEIADSMMNPCMMAFGLQSV